MSVLSNLVARLVGDVGTKQYADGATSVEVQLSRQGAVHIAPSAGKYAAAALAGRLYSGCNQAKIATTAGLATAYTGFALANPVTSGKNAIILEAGWASEIAVSDAGTIGLMWYPIGTTTHAADVAAYNCKLGGANSAMLIDNGTTIGTPLLCRVIGSYGTGATNLFEGYGPCVYDVGGSIVVTPGYGIAFYTTTATTACFNFHLVWEEVPV